MKKIPRIIFVIFVSLWAVWPLLGKNYIPTHDGEYHIIRIVEFSKELAAGRVVPRWAPDMNSGYGIPIFNYHYPLPNYIGSFVRAFTRDAVYAFQVSMGIGYIAVALFAYLWLSALFGPLPALVGSIVTAFTPYLFVDTYIRGSIGEVWATAFLLLSFFCIEKKKYVWFAAAYGLLILSHNILAMLYTPFMFGYAFIQNKKVIPWMIGGLGMSAFFWIPALVESKYVVGLNTVNFREHFVDWYNLLIPSWGSGFSGSGAGAMSVQIGIVPLFAIIAAFTRKKTRMGAYFFAVFACCVFFMLSVSAPIWNIFPPLRLIQYPWRLLSFVLPIAGFCAAFWTYSVKHKWLGIALAAAAILLSFSYARPVLYAPRNEAYYLSQPNFINGTSSMGNSFSTIWTGWKDTPATGGATLYFPGWKAYVNGRELPITNEKGVIGVTASATLQFTETPVRLLADIISIVSIITLLLCILL